MKIRRGHRGQAIAEFALALPVFLILLLGLFDVGRAVFVYNSMTNAAREGARLAIVNQDENAIEARASAQSQGADVSVCVVFLQVGETSDRCSGPPPLPTCPIIVGDPIAIGCVAHVEVSTLWSPITPIIGDILGPFNLTAMSEVPVEFTCPTPLVPAWNSAANCPKQP